MTKLFVKIMLVLGATMIVVIAGAIAYPPFGGDDSISDFLLPASGSLLGIVSYFLCRSESGTGAKLVFLNFAIFFGHNALARPFYQIVKRGFLASNEWSDLYYFEYAWILYFMLLSFSVMYLVIDHMMSSRSAYVKYFSTLAVALGVSVVAFSPFLLDAKYVYHTLDVRNFVAVRDSMKSLQKAGNPNPTVEAVASIAQITLPKDIDPKDDLSGKRKQTYVAKLLQYVSAEDYRMLLFRPLFARCSQIGLLNVFFILFYIAYQYLADSPRGAFLEKIVWSLLPLCGFEALHTFAYTEVTTVDLFSRIAEAGVYLSMAVMWLLLSLFSLRLWFIQTIEGSYYERQLLNDPRRITRWRDSFDKWVLKEFMNPGELDRRFLVQRQMQD